MTDKEFNEFLKTVDTKTNPTWKEYVEVLKKDIHKRLDGFDYSEVEEFLNTEDSIRQMINAYIDNVKYYIKENINWREHFKKYGITDGLNMSLELQF